MSQTPYNRKSTNRTDFINRGCLVIERNGYRKVYPAGDPFSNRQPPFDLELLSDILDDVIAALYYSWDHNSKGGGQL
ncbi:hypothetical protein ES708_12867 [subsurface metagenome]